MSGRGRPPGRGNSHRGGNRWGNSNNYYHRGSGRSPSNSRGSSPARGPRGRGNGFGAPHPRGGRSGHRGRPPLSHNHKKFQRPPPPPPSPNSASSSSDRSNSDVSGSSGSRKHRRPKFLDNPSAPEIVEKKALKTPPLLSPSGVSNRNSGLGSPASPMKSPVPSGANNKPDWEQTSSSTENGHREEDSLKSPVRESASSSNGVPLPTTSSGPIKDKMTEMDGEPSDGAEGANMVKMIKDSTVVIGSCSSDGSSKAGLDQGQTTSDSRSNLTNGGSEEAPPPQEPPASGDFRQMVFKQLLREDLNKKSAVSSDKECSSVVKKETLDDLKASMTDILKNVISKSKSETREAGFHMSEKELLSSLTSDPFQDSVKTILENFLQTKLDAGNSSKAPEFSEESSSSIPKVVSSASDTANDDGSRSADSSEVVTTVSPKQIDATVEDLLKSLHNNVMEENEGDQQADCAEGGLNNDNDQSGGIVTLDRLGKGMVPYNSVEIVDESADDENNKHSRPATLNIQDIEMLEEPPLSEKSPSKPSLSIDRSKLFSQMEDKFAKETHLALKNKPVYRKRSLLSPEQLSDNGRSNGSPPPPVLTPANADQSCLDDSQQNKAKIGPDPCNDRDDKTVIPSGSPQRRMPKPIDDISSQIHPIVLGGRDKAELPSGDDQPPSLECQVPPPIDAIASGNSLMSPQASQPSIPTSSELTKSLRKVRVRRARTSSSGNPNTESDDSNLAPPSLTLSLHSGMDGSTVRDPSASPTRIVRPRILATPSKTPDPVSPTESCSKGPSVSVAPLNIEIPEEQSSHSVLMSPTSSTSISNIPKHRTLLMTPAASVERFSVREQLPFNPAVISKADAFHACFAVFERELKSLQTRQVSPKNDPEVNCGFPLGESKLAQGTLISPNLSSTSQQPKPHVPLKTVIRLPKPIQNHNSSSSTLSSNATAPSHAIPNVVNPTVDASACQSASSAGGSGGQHHSKKKKGRKLGLSHQFDEVDDPMDDDLEARPSKRAKNTSGIPPTQELTLDLERYLAADDMSDADETSGDSRSGTTTGKHSPDLGNNLLQVKSDDKILESMVVPEKASSFNIHPGRCCSDVCHYCGMKFGMLDTPLHVSQLKTTEIQKFATEFASITPDACLCDKCFRYIDRTAKAKSNEPCSNEGGWRKGSQERSERGRSCLVRNCNREVMTSVSKKWLIRLKRKLSRKVTLNWEKVTKSSAKSVHGMCTKHNALVESFTKCGLCKQKLTIGGICGLAMQKDEIRELNEMLQNDNIPADLYENVFVCKHCKLFCGIKKKAKEHDYLKTNKTHKAFYKEHRRKLHVHLGKEDGYLSESHSPKKINQVIQGDNPTKITIKTTTLDVSNDRPSRKRKTKEFASPTSDAKILVTTNFDDDRPISTPSNAKVNGPSTSTAPVSSSSNPAKSPGVPQAPNDKCSVNIQFDQNTKKLFQDLHHPYGNYTSFIRHLILLEKYWRNGDITLAETANQKASVYVKSVKNRIDAYEGKNKRSDEDLSESTRPDLSVPSAPDVLHLPVIEDEDGSEVDSTYTEKEQSVSPTQSASRKDSTDSTILRIPKVPISGTGTNSNQTLPAESPANLPTKIRVRTDLMHLGLMAKPPEPNLMSNRGPVRSMEQLPQSVSVSPRKESFKIEDLVAPSNARQFTQSPTLTSTVPGGPLSADGVSSSQSSLLQMLNEPPVFKKRDPLASLGRMDGTTAAANAKKVDMMHRTSTAEKANSRVVITPVTAGHKPDSQRVPDISSLTNWMMTEGKKSSTNSASSGGGPSAFNHHKSPSTSSGGTFSLQKSQKVKAAAGSGSISNSGVSNIHPLMDMSKLLQTQKPGLPPHIVAQSSVPHSGGNPPTPNKPARIVPKPGPLSQQVRPVQLGGGKTSTTASAVQGIQTVNKKSLNTVLDRLSGLKGVSTISGSPTSGSVPLSSSTITVPTSSFKNTSSSSHHGGSSYSSSLVQQLNAPPMNKPSSAGNRTQANNTSVTNAQARTTANTANLANSFSNAALAAGAQNLFGFGSPMVGQPMVQYPWANSPSEQHQQQAVAQQQQHQQVAAQAAMFFAMAGLPMSSAQEFMNLSYQQQERMLASLTSGAIPNAATTSGQSRIRAPPPLTHMGRPGAGSAGVLPRPKKD
ncbi:hypothetical protein TCAL_16669 [Tigriopus californicus]|uniref:Uncharacterized protein n=1 Tax=Tigriopus californicus TaxID=6832 RepID=A0A553PL84_TIGCA|nr:hypothetical protein TCAL_16669 [Tigriopus californicus]